MSRDSEKGRYTNPEGSAIWEYVATMTCSLMIFSVGLVIGWSSPTLSILRRPDSPILLSSSDTSTLSSMISLGHTLAPTLTTVMATKLGRKNSLLATGIPTFISWALIALTKNFTALLVARFFGGLSVGLILCFPPMYLGEIASPKFRGAIGMASGIMISAGLLLMFVFVPYISIPTTAWICLSVTVIATVSAWFIPESPYYLVMVGRFDEAEGALEKLRGKTDVSEEMELIKKTVSLKDNLSKNSEKGEEPETKKKLSTLEQLFMVAGNRKALFINFWFQIVLQLGSFAPSMIYGQIIFEKMNTGISAHLCIMIIASLQLVCLILTAFVIDRIGRKPLICISGVCSGVCVLAISVYFFLMEYTKIDVTPYGIYALCAVFANIVSLDIGLVPLQNVIQSEILDTEIKGLATCLIGVGGGVLAMIGVKSYLTVAETWGFGHCVPFFFYVANTWISTAVILKMLPETKGKTLLDIQKDLNA